MDGAPPPTRPSTRARAALAAVLLAGALSQALALLHDWRVDPFARVPLNDAEVYWRWAGTLASGELIGRAPYFSAPLYPWLVGLLRAAGGGLCALYVLQALAHLATAALIARATRMSFGASAGVLAALAWVLLDDASYGTARVLNGALQALLVAWTWERASAWRIEPTRRRALFLGLALGLCVLADPILLAGVPLFALWAWMIAPRAQRVSASVCIGLTALLAIAPATVHNALACGELIPVSAQAGVTFAHGNAPGADGTYHAIEGVSTDRARQNDDARALVRAETDGSWNATSSAFFHRGLAWWRAEPGAAFTLFLRKLWWFASGHDYGDIYAPVLEARDGWSIATRVAPLRAAWIVLPGLVVLAWLARSPRQHAPELVLVLAALGTVAFFWYSPRYRLPALPLLCAFAFAPLASARFTRGWRVAVLAAFACALASGPLDAALGFDALEPRRAQYEYLAGKALLELERVDEALPRLRTAAALGHAEAATALGDALRRSGATDDALELLRDNVRRQPASTFAHRALAVALAGAKQLDEAQREFEAALALDPRDAEASSGLGNVLLERGDARAAAEKQRAALALRPDWDVAQHNLGLALEQLGELGEAELAFRAALASNPRLARSSAHVADLRARACDFAGASSELARALALTPGDRGLVTRRAWLLATAPDARDRDGTSALALIEPWTQRARDDAGVWSVYAAVLAECGRFDEALEAATRTLELVRAQGSADALRDAQERLELYRSKRPYHQPPC